MNPFARIAICTSIVLSLTIQATTFGFQQNRSAASPQSTQLTSPDQPQTVAETSHFTATSTSEEVKQFIELCDKHARHIQSFVFGKSVEGRDLIAITIAGEYWEMGEPDERNVVLILGNIHPGECSGKEALLMILRELTHQPNSNWLDNNVIVMVPNYNPDGNDRFGLRNRPGQIGPEKGAGVRENAQDLDLNRDWVKLEAPETRALVALANKINPDVFIDCHTTNGSKHRYPLTYDIPHNPATSSAIRDYMRNTMMPEITRQMEAKGQDTFYYGNFNRDMTTWTSFGHEPRYSTEYFGMRGCLSVLVEDYSYIGYRERVVVSKDFVESTLDYVSRNRSQIKELLDADRMHWRDTASLQPYRFNLSLAAEVKPFQNKVLIKGFKGDEPHDYECIHLANYVSSKSTPLPYAYVVPKQYVRLIERLKMHGIVAEPLDSNLNTSVEIDTIIDQKAQPNAFQKHRNRQVEVERKTVGQPVNFGDYIVLTEQPLGRLAGYLLEAASDDGFVFWNFLDGELETGKPYPILRLPDSIGLTTDGSAELINRAQLTLDLIDGPHSLLETVPTVQWIGDTNLIETKMGNRTMVLNARTASLAERPAVPFRAQDLQATLTEAGFSSEDAAALASATPTVSVNGKYAILANDQRSIIHSIPQGDVPGTVLEIGSVELTSSPSNEGGENENKNENDGKLGETSSSITGPAELFEFNHDESKLAYVTSKGLYVTDLATKSHQSVDTPNDQHLIGKLDWVYQEELYGRGNFKAHWWNPNGNELAFLSLDESRVPGFIVMDHLPVRGNAEVTHYPKAGEPLPTVKLGILNADSGGEPVWVDLSQYGSEELLISRVTWSSKGEWLLVQVQNRQQTWLDLIAVDRQGKNLKVLFRDRTPAWIRSPGDPVFVSDHEFLWVSPRDGYRRIYRYNLDGRILRTLTQGQWEVRELLGVDPEQRFAFFSGSENPVEGHCYRLDLNTETLQQITHGPGTHQVSFSKDFSLFLDRFSDTLNPTEIRVCDSEGTLLHKLHVRSDDRLEYMNLVAPEFLNVPTRDGGVMDAMLIKPIGFSPYTRHPVLIHVYAGPQAPQARNRFGGANYLWHQMLAQQGVLVLVLDVRSASYRNSSETWKIHKQMAVAELADLEDGVAWLKRQTWCDPARLGIWGWSYGGYMTAYAMVNSKAFKVGISGAPVTDWKNYDAIYTERYMGLPDENPDGYRVSSVLHNAAQLHGKLLLIHGTIDDNVHLNNTLQLVKEFQDAGVMFDLMLYPANRHGVTQPAQTRHMRKLMTDYILNHL